jgi:hypothetical protein
MYTECRRFKEYWHLYQRSDSTSVMIAKVLPHGVSATPVQFAVALILLLGALCCAQALAQSLSPGSYSWYVPEHERYGRTAFYAKPGFNNATVRVTRTQRFRLIGARKGWALIEFDVAGKAYVHLRILRNLLYDPAASDPWYEFKRASVFAEEPAKIEARLTRRTSAPAPVVDSKLPAWKRYKENWGLKSGRSTLPSGVGETDPDATEQPTSRPLPGTTAAKKRNKYPLLPPIGSDPQTDETTLERNARDPDAAASR